MASSQTCSKTRVPYVLRALVIQLQAQEAGVLPGTLGEIANAAFYNLVRQADPALAKQIHDGQHRKTFALSPLFGYTDDFHVDRVSVHIGQEGWLRVVILDDRLFSAFAGYLLETPCPTLRLGALHFQITQVLGSSNSHPWAGYMPLERLRALQPDTDRWRLVFASPMAIGMGRSETGRRRMILFPVPRAVIAGLRSRWDSWTGEAWGRDFEEWVERNVVVTRVWEWRTVPFRYRRQIYVGGLGQVEYRLLSTLDSPRAAHLHRLLHLAFYTGVGYKTTHGLGMVRTRP